jgi:hypothetical protein
MRYDPQNAIDVTRRTDAPTNHKGCVMTEGVRRKPRRLSGSGEADLSGFSP